LPGLGPKLGLAAQVGFLGLCLTLVTAYRGTPVFSTFSITFVAIVLEAMPFVLLGVLIGGAIEVLIPRDRMAALFPASPLLSVTIAGGLGLLFPVCECAIVPVVRRLLAKGFPIGAAVAFLLGGPIVNPIVGASTLIAYGGAWSIAADRLLTGYLVAVTIGFLVGAIFKNRQATVSEALDGSCSLWGDHGPERPSPISRAASVIRHAMDDFIDVGRFLVIGAFIAAGLQALISRQDLIDPTAAPMTSTLMMMTLALVLNLCSEADAFVAASFRSSGIPLTAQMAFMVLGPMLDIKLLFMYLTLFRKRFILVLSGLILSVVSAVMAAKGVAQGW
jgi:uncharacterized membrane protein YraQ (UPF0718 family)